VGVDERTLEGNGVLLLLLLLHSSVIESFLTSLCFARFALGPCLTGDANLFPVLTEQFIQTLREILSKNVYGNIIGG